MRRPSSLPRVRGSAFVLCLIVLQAAGAALAQQPAEAATAARRLQVLFLGAPTANGPHHDPITRYATLKRGLGASGIDLTYSEEPAVAFTAPFLAAFDAVLLYGNWAQQGTLPEAQLQALLGFVEQGGGFVPVHCASACWGRSPKFVRLVGGRFQSHGGEEFAVQNVAADHPVLQDLDGYRAWDETYVHDEHAGDRTILQVRGGEPWTWTRTQGKGRVFYTAGGHDHRVWDLPAFQQLLARGLIWAAGDAAKARLEAVGVPKLEEEVVSLPGYRQRREITRAQKPLSPADSQKLAMVPVGWQLQLFASEPDIVNPIHVAWDERGRAFVTETVDYPNNLQKGDLGHDRITICEDTDGDGKADRFTRFAEKLSIPTSLTFADGGVICTNGTDVLFLADTDGDGKADVRRVLLHGFHMGDTHAGVSNLRYGPDGWIWATVGYSGFRGTVAGKALEFEQGVLRFRHDGSALEFVQHTTNNTWGLGFTAAGDVLGSTANGNPSWYHTFPIAAYEAVGMTAPSTPRADDDPKFFPMSTDIRQVDFFDRYTAAAGHGIATGSRLPAAWNDTVAFVCEPTGKLVARFDLVRKGAGFVARQSPNNLYCSADAWSAPVCAEVGPDGALWICDWYNLIVQHNPTPTRTSAGVDARTGRGNAYETPLRDTQHGRIWRVFPKGAVAEAQPKLATTQDQLRALAHPHHGWRLQAQRLLIQGADAAATAELVQLARAAGTAAPHALRVLAARNALPTGLTEACLRTKHEPTVRTALDLADGAAVRRVFLGKDGITAQGRLLAEVLVKLSNSAADPELAAALVRTGKSQEAAIFADATLRDAWTIAARRHAAGVLAAAKAEGLLQPVAVEPKNLLPNPGFADAADGKPAGWADLRIYSGARAPTVQVTQAADGRGGTPGLRITTSEPSDCGVAVTVPVQPATRYRLSGWIRTAEVEPRRGSDGAMLNVHGGVRTKGVQGTTDWTQVGAEFESGDRDEIVVHCLFGGYGGASGTAWFDDVSLVALGSGATLAGALTALAALPAMAPTAAAAPATRQFVPDAAIHERGAAVYARTCITCHGIDGKGLPKQFPPIDGSPLLTGDAKLPIRIVLHGLMGPVRVGDATFDSAMTPLGPMLNDAEIADVLTYVRQRWSNDAAPVDAATVKAIRDAAGERSLWTIAELEKQR